MRQRVYSVGQINSYIKNMFTQDFVLNRVSIQGEVSNCKYHSSGHIYFSLKDTTGTIACILFASARRELAFRLSDGMQVVADGSVNVYERDGKYQLYVSRVRQSGAGMLYERFLALKQELEEMGMFSPEYKQPIPAFVKRLGIVTAPTGAAVRDIINVSTRRSPGIQIILYPAKVQGDGAAESVADGLRALDALGLDAIIVGRGGGSIEDLWAFNEEVVARAIFECRTPVISAVGHETDTTIADFAADLRAPTPSAAAELAVPDVSAIAESLQMRWESLNRQMQSRISDSRTRLQMRKLRLEHASPAARVWEQRERLAGLEEDIQRSMQQLLERRRTSLALYVEKLKNVSPLEKLTQGYACVTDETGNRVHSVQGVHPGETLRIYVRDGCMEAEVTGTEEIRL